MKKVTFFVSFLAFFLAGIVYSAEAQERDERQVNGTFDEVSVSSGVDLFLKQGDGFEVVVEADKDDMEDVITELKGRCLNVYMDRGVFSWFGNSRQVKVYVTLPEVSKLSSSGGADLKSVGEIRADKLEINSSGGADAEVSVSANTLILHCSGGADIRIEGKADILKAESSGGADIFAKKLHASKVVASSSGGADLEVYVLDEIEASASGGADVDYFGPGKATRINESGGGDVRGH